MARPAPQTAADLAAFLDKLGYGGRAARIQRCGPGPRQCRDRLCSRCGKRWASKHFASLLQRTLELGDRTAIFATLKTSRATAAAAMASHRRAYERFRARTPWP